MLQPKCSKCGCELDETNWHLSAHRNNQYTCKKCKRKYLKQWRAANPDNWMEYKYGLSREEYDDMLFQQGGCCAICGTTEPGGKHKTWHIDHDHVTKKVRGLLCSICNRGLGLFKDNSNILRKAAEYLDENK